MTEAQKTQLKEQVKQLTDGMYDAMVNAYEMVEKDLPTSFNEQQKQDVFTQLFNTCFETQKSLLTATMHDVENKIKDKEFMNGLKEVKNG